MGALPPGTVRISTSLEVCHFFQKNLGLGEEGGYLQAFRLEKRLREGELSYGGYD